MRQTLRELRTRLGHFWAVRSLIIGGGATCVDVGVLVVVVKLLGLPTPIGAASGVLVGATVTFFANRHFAFRDHSPHLAPQFLKFSTATLIGMGFHAATVTVLRDRLGVPLVPAKLLADVLVFSVGQLLVLRYLVFPRRRRRDRSPPPSD